MIDALIKKRNLERGWGLGAPCGHQGTGQDALSVNQGRAAQTARNPLKMKRDSVYLPLEELIIDTVVPFSGLQNIETKIPSSCSTPGISKPVGCDPPYRNHISYTLHTRYLHYNS